MADISKLKLPDGNEYNIKDATARANSGVTGVKGNAESSYKTGNVNLTADQVGAITKNQKGNTQYLVRPVALRGVADNTLQTLFNVTRANRLAFLPADQIIVEKTTDGGTTWVDAEISDSNKKQIFAETRAWYMPIPLINGRRNLLCGLRITISAMKYNVPNNTPETEKYNYWNKDYVNKAERYTQLKELYFWLTSSNDTIGVKVERATGANPNNWALLFNDTSFYMYGWSGANYVRFTQNVFGGSISQTANYWNYRITLMTKGVNGTDTMNTGYETQVQGVAEIRGYGDSVWTKSNEYMAFDKFYTHDADQNVTFPAKVTASGGFIGGADKLTGFASRQSNLTWGNQIGTTITGMDDDAGGSMGFRKNNPAAGQMSMVIDGTVYVKEGVNRVLDEGDLSTSTSSTSTTTAATSSAVKTAYDLASSANTTANTALSGVNGTLIYDHTYTISNGVATFVPHVYLKGAEVTANYAASCFTWKYRLSNNVSATPSYVNLTTDTTTKGCTVNISTLGFGGHVIGTFTPPS